VILAAGCGPSYGPTIPPETAVADAEVAVEAYLFDAKLRRRGKPTSFRLEIYRTDSVTALNGRGYLGKNALRGRMTDDSLEVYFPSSNEYLYEAVVDLVVASDCTSELSVLRLPALLATPPEEGSLGDAGVDRRDPSDSERQELTITWPSCPWRMELLYDRRDGEWRLREFFFDDGGETTLTADRRTYKSRANIKGRYFLMRMPSDAVRITP